MLRILDQTRYEIFREVLGAVIVGHVEDGVPQWMVDRAHEITQAAAEKLKSAGIAEARE